MLPNPGISHDDELLNAWVLRRDHAAFRALVGKYTGLVYGTALRKLGRVDWAEEMVQEVFILFARQSSGMRGAGGLAAWLHRAAIFKAAARLRAEIRHRGRMEKLAGMFAGGEPGEGTGLCGTVSGRDWEQLKPQLDEAVAALTERDRRVVLLHYFDHKSYAEIAALTGDSHEAARKRGGRALEKLHRILRGRGVALPAAAIGGGLSAAFQETAPAGLLPLAAKAASAGIVAATLAGPGATFLTAFSLSSLFAMKTSFTVTVTAAAVLVVAAGSTAVWWSRTHGEAGAVSSVKSIPAAATSPPNAAPARLDHSSPGQKRVTLTAAAASNKSLPPPVPIPASTGPRSPASQLDPALREIFQKDPRTKKAELRINALKGGFKGLLNLRIQAYNLKKNLMDEATRRSRDSSLSPADQAAALAKIEPLKMEMKSIMENVETFRMESEAWVQSEVMIQRDDILAQIAKEGGVSAPPPPPEPDTPDAVNFPAYRAADELMQGDRFDEALTAFTDLAKSSTGKVRDQSYWNAMLCGLITGNAEAVDSASLPLLRSTPASACYAMAAKAIQQNEWGDAQAWVTAGFKSGDATESHTFQVALERLGWADDSCWLIPPPSPVKSGS